MKLDSETRGAVLPKQIVTRPDEGDSPVKIVFLCVVSSPDRGQSRKRVPFVGHESESQQI